MIAIVDYGAGNLRSVQRALDSLEQENVISSRFPARRRSCFRASVTSPRLPALTVWACRKPLWMHSNEEPRSWASAWECSGSIRVALSLPRRRAWESCPAAATDSRRRSNRRTWAGTRCRSILPRVCFAESNLPISCTSLIPSDVLLVTQPLPAAVMERPSPRPWSASTCSEFNFIRKNQARQASRC